jgi:hypothetical protein
MAIHQRLEQYTACSLRAHTKAEIARTARKWHSNNKVSFTGLDRC